jgi:hypothetical protein
LGQADEEVRRLRAWFDCEFYSFEDLRPISFGAVQEDGFSVYVEFPVDRTRCSAWLLENVIPKLASEHDLSFATTTEQASKAIAKWIGNWHITEMICDTSYDERIARSLGVTLPITQADVKGWDKPHDHHALRDAVELMRLNT